MKRIILSILFPATTFCSFAQGMFGLQAGMGTVTAYKPYYTPSFEGYYLAKLTPHVYLGGAVSVQRYSFLYDLDKGSNISYGDVLTIRQKSSYIFFTPKIDCGVGYYKYVHFTFSFGPGVFMTGAKTTGNYEPLISPTGGFSGGDTLYYNAKYNMRTVIFRYAFGIMERIPTRGYWNITLSQEFSYLPGKLNYPGIDLMANYILFSVGIMHKYPLMKVEY